MDTNDLDDSVIYPGPRIRTEMLDDSFKNIKTVPDQSGELRKLRIDNFNLRLLCHKYEVVFNNGQIENVGLQENSKLREQLGRASRTLSSLKHENDGLRKECDELGLKYQNCESEWRSRFDLLNFEFQELKSSQRKAESRCETLENESFRLENVKNAEIAVLQQKLISAESKIEVLEAELVELRKKGDTASNPYASSLLDVEDKENVPLLDLDTLLEPLSSPCKVRDSHLLLRCTATQEALKSLKHNYESLTAELATCRQELAISESKHNLLSEQYTEAVKNHLEDLELRKNLERDLHNKITNLIDECNHKAEMNDRLCEEIEQLKEIDARNKEEHKIQINKLNRLLVDRERALLELYAPEHTEANSAPTSLNESGTIAEVTQYHHEPNSSIFNSTAELGLASTRDALQQPEQLGVMSFQMAKLQHEVAQLRSKLAAQVKANSRLKIAYNALMESNPSKAITPGTTVPPPAIATNKSISHIEEAGRSYDSIVNLTNLLGSDKKVSQTLDKTVNELKSVLTKVEAELSASLLEVSQDLGGDEVKPQAEEAQGPSGPEKSDRLRDAYYLIKSLVSQIENLRTFRKSFNDSVNQSVLANSSCFETSSRYAAPGHKHTPSTSFSESVKENFEISVEEVSKQDDERDDSITEEMSVVSQNNNTTFNLLRENLNNTLEDLSVNTSMSLGGHSALNALDITQLETHSRDVFDRVALAVAGIQEALDAWSLDAVTELLAAFNMTDTEKLKSDCDYAKPIAESSSLSVSTLLDLVTKYVELLSKTKSVEVVDSQAFCEWNDLVQKWFELFIDALQSGRGSSTLTEIGLQLDALERQFKEEFAISTAAVTQYHLSSALHTSEVFAEPMTESPSISLNGKEDSVAASTELLASTIEKLKCDLSLNVKNLTEKESEVTDLNSKLKELERQLADTLSLIRTKESKIGDLEAEISQLETKMGTLELDVAESIWNAQMKEAKIRELEGELAGSEAKLQNVEVQLTDALSADRAKNARIQNLEAAMAEKNLELFELKDHFAETETKLAQKEARVSEFKRALKDLREINDELESRLSKTGLESEHLEDMLKQCRVQEAAIKVELTNALESVEEHKLKTVTLERKLRESEVKLEKVHIHYQSLLEVVELRCKEACEQCDLLRSERDTLREELDKYKDEKVILESDLTVARLVSAGAQLDLDKLMEEVATQKPSEGEDVETLRKVSRRYSKLRALAFQLKAKLDRRYAHLNDSTKELTRLKAIVGDNETRVKELVMELERLRQQILVKNGVIKKLEALLKFSTMERLSPSLSEKPDEISPQENARAVPPNYLSPQLITININPNTTTELVDGFNGVNSLMADIGATMREISVCLDAASAVEGGRSEHHDNTTTSVSLVADRIVSNLSTDTPSSLIVSLADDASTRQCNEDVNLPDRLNHLVLKLSTFWTAMTHELQALLNCFQTNTAHVGECDCKDHKRARKLVRRGVEALDKVNTQVPANALISLVQESLNEALRLLQEGFSCSSTSSSSTLSELHSHQQQLMIVGSQGETATVTTRSPVNPPNHSTDPTTGTLSTCSCSCRKRCSQMAASVGELNRILNSTANALVEHAETPVKERGVSRNHSSPK